MTAATLHLPANPVEAHKVYAGPLREILKAHAVAGNATVVEVRTAEDVKTDKQRRYLHGYVLLTIAREARVNGQQFDMRTWKEWYRATFLGWKVVTFKDPFSGKKVRRRQRVSTEDLGVKGYSEYIERVTAHAASELGVEFREEWIDPETGEVFTLTAMKSKRTV